MAHWQTLGFVPLEQLSDARLELHGASVALASVAESLLARRPDDSQSNLGLLSVGGGFATHELGGAGSGERLTLRVPEQTLAWRSGDATRAEFPLVGNTLASALGWAAEVAGEALGRAVTVDERKFPDMPAIDALAGGAYRRADPEALGALLAWYQNASALLAGLRRRDDALSDDRVWPHHFDLGALLSVREPDVAIGLGLSPGDSFSPAPYFYVSPYPQPDADAALPPVPVGAWTCAEGGTCAERGVPTMAWLSAEEVLHASNQADCAETYLRGAVEACRSLLL